MGSYWMAHASARQPGSSIVNIASVRIDQILCAPVCLLREQGRGDRADAGSISTVVRPQRIRVNAIAPGYFASETTDEMGVLLGNFVEQNTTLKRLGEQRELRCRRGVSRQRRCFLHHGNTLPVDGGMSGH